MNYTSTSLIKRARALADLPETTFISYEDEVNSLNEAYKQVYTKLVANDDDYFVKTVQLTINPATKQLNDVYFVDLPEDCMSVRLICYQDNGTWLNMPKFSLSQINVSMGRPFYRIQNQKLEIKQPNSLFFGNIQLYYYPKPASVSKPRPSIGYNRLAAPSAVLQGYSYVDAIGTADETDYFFYVTPTTYQLRVASKKLNLDTLIAATSTDARSNVFYANSTLYWIQVDTGVKKLYSFRLPVENIPTHASTSFAATLLVSDAVAATYSNGVIAYKQADNSFKANWAESIGDIDNDLSAIPATATMPVYVGDRSTTGLNETMFKWTDGAVLSGTTIQAVWVWWYDGSIYYTPLFTSPDIYRLNDDQLGGTLVGTFLPVSPAHLENPVGFQLQGELIGGYISTYKTGQIVANSIIEDTVFDYPVNVFWEVVSATAAVDFKIKQNADPSGVQAKLTTLADELDRSIRRDDYAVARINNYYTQEWGLR